MSDRGEDRRAPDRHGMTVYAVAIMGDGTSLALAVPRGATSVPPFDAGWLVAGGEREPFIAYVDSDPSVNWSDELERAARGEHAHALHRPVDAQRDPRTRSARCRPRP